MGLYRSRNNKMIAGVCGGIAEWLGWSPTAVRIAYVVISIAVGRVPRHARLHHPLDRDAEGAARGVASGDGPPPDPRRRARRRAGRPAAAQRPAGQRPLRRDPSARTSPSPGPVIAGVGAGLCGPAGRSTSAGAIVCPGFLDAHVHIESSMVPPAEFARAVVPRGVTTVVTDPHEIGNVLGARRHPLHARATPRARRWTSWSTRPPACRPPTWRPPARGWRRPTWSALLVRAAGARPRRGDELPRRDRRATRRSSPSSAPSAAGRSTATAPASPGTGCPPTPPRASARTTSASRSRRRGRSCARAWPSSCARRPTPATCATCSPWSPRPTSGASASAPTTASRSTCWGRARSTISSASPSPRGSIR